MFSMTNMNSVENDSIYCFIEFPIQYTSSLQTHILVKCKYWVGLPNYADNLTKHAGRQFSINCKPYRQNLHSLRAKRLLLGLLLSDNFIIGLPNPHLIIVIYIYIYLKVTMNAIHGGHYIDRHSMFFHLTK